MTAPDPVWTPLVALADLKPGTLVRGRNGLGYVVTANYGDHVIAARTVEITQLSEWAYLKREDPDD